MGPSGRTCTPTLYCQEAPPCTLVSLIVCRRRLLPWLPAPSRSRSSPHQRGNTPAGSEDPSSHHSPHSNRCGSPRQNMTSLVHPLYTGSASKHHYTRCLNTRCLNTRCLNTRCLNTRCLN